uniref:G_PROTEIN_RECEP_F1_2 domain-containing protein n=1 Tax=Heligmosomoides polygyrus TaxID=6339 RepID=A0A183FTM4_HELPZ
LLILNWMCMIYFSLWPYDEFLSISKEVWPDGSVNVTGRCYIAISNRNGSDPLKMAILIESLVMLLSVAQISPFCAMRIHRCLKENSFSSRTKALHNQMLILLSIQVIRMFFFTIISFLWWRSYEKKNPRKFKFPQLPVYNLYVF